MRMAFDELFRRDAEGMISPRLPVRVEGVTMSPDADSGADVLVAGVDLAQFVGKNLEVEIHDGAHVIKGVLD